MRKLTYGICIDRLAWPCSSRGRTGAGAPPAFLPLSAPSWSFRIPAFSWFSPTMGSSRPLRLPGHRWIQTSSDLSSEHWQSRLPLSSILDTTHIPSLSSFSSRLNMFQEDGLQNPLPAKPPLDPGWQKSPNLVSQLPGMAGSH